MSDITESHIELKVFPPSLRFGWRWSSDRLWFGDRTHGPFLIIGRQNGLALDDGRQDQNGSKPIMWPPNGLIHQLWKVRAVKNHWAEYVIESVENRLVLDAGTSEEFSRNPTMRSRTDEPAQRWRFSRTDDKNAYVLRSALTGHALDFPVDSPPMSIPHLYPCDRKKAHQQFLVVSVSAARMREIE